MKRMLPAWLFTVIVAAVSRGQEFTNLKFEDAKISFVPGSTVNVATSNALPGWSAFLGTNELTTVPYNDFAIPFPWGLVGSNNLVIDGNFSASLEGDESISQKGLVPSGTESLLFSADSYFLDVSLGGQSLSYAAISNALNSSGMSYALYGANISGFAGQVETLTFSVGLAGSGRGILDDIQFSPEAVPEPSSVSLISLGGAVLFYLRRKYRR